MPKSLSVKSITLAVLLVAAINLLWSFYQIHLDSIVAREAAKHGVILCDLGAYGEVLSRIYIGLSMLCSPEQSLAADGAIAWFSSYFFLLSLNAARAPQLKRRR
jgi:hypothetical protein